LFQLKIKKAVLSHLWVEIHKTSEDKFVQFFITLGLKILRFLRLKLVFEADIIKDYVIIINDLFFMNNCVVKASES